MLLEDDFEVCLRNTECERLLLLRMCISSQHNPPSHAHVTLMCTEKDNLHKYSCWQINHGKKCRFISKWASYLSRSLALFRLLLFVKHSHFHIPVCSQYPAARSVLPVCFDLMWQPDLWQVYCLFPLYSLYFPFAIIGHGLKEIHCSVPLSDTSSITHVQMSTHVAIKVWCCLKLSCPLHLAQKERWQVYDCCNTLKVCCKSFL